MDGLFEAAGNQNIIPRNELWQDVQEAVKALPNDAVCRGHLQAAAEKLQRARRRSVRQPSILSIYACSMLMIRPDHCLHPSAGVCLSTS